MSSENHTERILRFLSTKTYRPQRVGALARAMSIAEDEHGNFRQTIKALAKTGRVVLGNRNVLTLPEPSGTIVGSFRANPAGFGFVIPELPTAHGDLYIPRGETRDAMTGDTVRARVTRKGKRDGKMLYEGRVLEILKRGQSQFVGQLFHEFGRWFVRPDGRTFHGPIFIDDASAKRGKAGDQVVVEILEYPSRGSDARGVVIKVLGKRGDPDVDLKSIIWQYGYPEEFPRAVLDEARQAAQDYDPEQHIDRREDLRDLTVITIDPDDARDFDDAISLTPCGAGTVELGVHIADVSAFVPPDSELDREAYERSNSVYFPGHVIPMLPETLSNGVCSLQEKRPRLTKSAFITYDAKGNVKSTRVANTVIHSAKRLTYRQATRTLEGKSGRFSKAVVELVKRAERLAKAIRQRRLRDGMLVLDLPEVDLALDDDGNVTGATPADTSFSHTIIEMFMVEANEAVARLLVGEQVPHLRRVHPEPEPAALEGLQRFLLAVGLSVPKDIDREALQRLLKVVKNRPASFAVNLAVLRSLAAAVYSPALEGHYALASQHYAHFTSPIRRYPDLTVHRLLDAYLSGQFKTKRGKHDVPTYAELEDVGRQCSLNERRAEAAEREHKLVKVLRLLEGRLGDEFEGVVTGVTNFGVFVQLRELLIDGLLRFDDLPDDWWEVDAVRGRVIGQSTGQTIAIGQVLPVIIAKVDVAGRQLDLSLRASTVITRGKRKQVAKKPKRSKAVRRGRPAGKKRAARTGGRKGKKR